MAVDSLRTHLIEELTDLLDAENQLTKALPKMAKSATSPALRSAFQRHLAETRGQITRLDRALRQLGEKPRRRTCEAMEGLLTEGEQVMHEAPAGALRDAVMITAAQKVEHYEMASYGTVRTYAQVLGEPGVARLLAQTLKEEKTADGKLTTIAKRSVNADAAEEWHAQSGEGALDKAGAWFGAAIGGASRRLTKGTRRAADSAGLARERAGVKPSRLRRTPSRKRAASKRSRARR